MPIMTPILPTQAPGSRPKGARDERQAAAQVREMFTKIAPRYDFLNHLLSLSIDRVWMKALRDSGAHRIPMVGCDFARPMLERARKKGQEHHRAAEFVASDALKLPFPDASFDLVTTAFGFRDL